MPSRFAIAPMLSPNGRPTLPNGADSKCTAPEFAELSDEAAEPYTDADDRSLQCEARIKRIGASL
jgi:hypothetical protein